MRFLLLCLFLPSLAWAGESWVFRGDLNRDGLADSIVPKSALGNSGGDFLVTLSRRGGKPLRQVAALNPNAAAAEWQSGKLRLWTLWHISCCEGRLGVTSISDAPETQFIDLDFGENPDAPSLASAIADAAFAGKYRLKFKREKKVNGSK